MCALANKGKLIHERERLFEHIHLQYVHLYSSRLIFHLTHWFKSLICIDVDSKNHNRRGYWESKHKYYPQKRGYPSNMDSLAGAMRIHISKSWRSPDIGPDMSWSASECLRRQVLIFPTWWSWWFEVIYKLKHSRPISIHAFSCI